jgi:ATP-dependent helicase/nuclease subunit A
MTATKLTGQQELAVITTGRDLLVASSAGTGKTTVLSQRVLHLLLHEGVMLKEILAVTFTEAAAADMRRKIAVELRRHLDAHPQDAALRRELLVIDRAPISTLHSFCLQVVREHFHLLELDPGFGILDPDEAVLLKSEVADRLLEDWFGRDGEDSRRFIALAEAYGGSGGADLVEVVLRLHDFLQTLPDPDKWRAETRSAYQPKSRFADLHWYGDFAELWNRQLRKCQMLAQDALAWIDQLGTVDVYRPYVETHILKLIEGWHGRLATLQTSDDWRSFLEDVRAHAWEKLPGKKVDSAEDRALAKEKIDAARDSVKEAIRSLASSDPEQIVKDIGMVSPFVDLLLRLQQEFDSAFGKEKERQAVLDFNDLERLCHRLLVMYPHVAIELRRRFRHVLVDEYQDINPLQDAVLQQVARSQDGESTCQLFMVGDEKQSIYGFRLADPQVFIEKFRRFASHAGSQDRDPSMKKTVPGLEGVRIPLTHNFRSRPDIIHAVNHIFERIVVPELGNSYGPEAALTCGAAYEACAGIPERFPVEVHLLEKDLQSADADDESVSDIDGTSLAEKSSLEREAFVMGNRIKQLIDSRTQVWDDAHGEYRDASYRDIVVLLRSTAKRADSVAAVLRSQGVRVHADMTTGFFEATEVRDTMALLDVLDNARQDVPLAAVLRSPLVGLTDDQLAAIRIELPDGRFHEAVWDYPDKGSDPAILGVLREFQQRVKRWRRDVLQLPLARVLWEIYRQTNYLAYVQGLPNGQARQANLVLLHDRARQFDQFSKRGLFRFLRFLGRLQDADHDLGTAPILSESDDVVRIMSIHKSKGLEFPIVFVADLGRRFNDSELKEHFLLHRSLFVGADRVDLDRMTRVETLPKKLIVERKLIDISAEEQRLLYVALTRARERLILCGTAVLGKIQSSWAAPTPDGCEARVMAARSMLDWLGPVLAGHPESARVLGTTPAAGPPDQSHFDLQTHAADEIAGWSRASVVKAAPAVDLAALLALQPLGTACDPAALADVQAVSDRLRWLYSMPHLRALPGKLSVTGFKRRGQSIAAEEQLDREHFRHKIVRQPAFLSKGTTAITATDRGTATHAVLQHLELANSFTSSDLRSAITALVAKGILSEREAAAIEIPWLAAFFDRSLGCRLRKAKRVRREMPFSLLIAAGELSDADRLDLNFEERGESILIQGIIDCLFWEGESVVLLDYKTDNVSESDLPAAAASYGVQIALYRRAIRNIFQVEVAESYLVFLKPGADVLV